MNGAGRDQIGAVIGRVGTIVALSAALLKAMVAISTFPGWSIDPFSLPAPESGMGPTAAMWCDLAMVLGAAGMIVGRWALGGAVRWVDGALVALGGVGIALHSKAAGASIGDQWIGSAWLGAMVLGLGVSHACRGERGDRTRGVVLGVLLGFVALLAVRGVEEVLVEHPATVADFMRNRDSILAAQGWSPESAMAKAYERRLNQSEATGWFGLANVLATFGAAGTVIGAVLTLGAMKGRAAPERRGFGIAILGPALALAAGITTTALAGSKGGVGAIALGVAVAAALTMLRRWKRSWPGGATGVGALAAVLALVVTSGLVGGKIGGLSILFRWFYMQAAARIFVAHPLTGVGPDGFQTAYMLAKNPLSPEDVTSSHDMLLDWPATLGILGLAWAAVWIMWVWRAGARAVTSDRPAEAREIDVDAARHDRWTLGAIGTLPTLIAMRLDQHVMTPELAVVRIFGLVAFCTVGWLVLASNRRADARWTGVALAAGGIAAAGHALIDVTGVWPGSAAMLALFVASAGAGRDTNSRSSGRGAALFVVFGALGLGWLTWPGPVRMWERGLRDGAAVAYDAGDLVQRWRDVSGGLEKNAPGALDLARELAGEIAARTGTSPRSPAEIDAAVREVDLNATREAFTKLESLAEHFPEEWKLRREASRLKLREAAIEEAKGDAHAAAATQADAVRIAEMAPEGVIRAASEWAWIGLVRQDAAAATPDVQQRLRGAAAAYEEAARLSPYELEYAHRLMGLYAQLGDRERAREWARRTLELDGYVKYDREVKGLTPSEREEASRLSAGS